jgi:hypothetical protein
MQARINPIVPVIDSIIINTRGIETKRGLQVGDSKMKALELYGIPDWGFVNKDKWIYYFYRNEDEKVICEDSFIITFNNDMVSEIELEAFIVPH